MLLDQAALTLFETAHVRVCELIDRFEKYARDNYLLPGYSEAAARKDFIDPFLKALGWDVDTSANTILTSRRSRSSAACRSTRHVRRSGPTTRFT
jgi:hypothetical protein